MRNATRPILMLPALILLAGCAGHVPEPGLVPGVPHISWTIHSGDAANPSQNLICQSDPRTDCVMPASREDRKVFASVQFFYHPAATEIRYTGSVEVGFFDERHELTANSTVKAGDSPSRHSIADIVSAKPGIYPMRIALVATSTPSGESQNIRDDVRVEVR